MEDKRTVKLEKVEWENVLGALESARRMLASSDQKMFDTSEALADIAAEIEKQTKGSRDEWEGDLNELVGESIKATEPEIMDEIDREEWSTETAAVGRYVKKFHEDLWERKVATYFGE
jgi:hypothetical protein